MTVALSLPPEKASRPLSTPSPAIWGNFPISNIVTFPNLGVGHFEFENFVNFPVVLTNTSGFAKGWNTFTSNGGAIADGAIANNASAAFSSDGDNEAAALAKCTAGIRITKGSGRVVAFETRVKFSSIADTKNGAFFGLFEPLVPTATSHIADAGTLVDANFLGFHRLEGDGDKLDIVYKADGITQISFQDAVTLVADTWVKIGFRFNGIDTVRFYVDGAEYTTAQLGVGTSYLLTSTSFPSDINLAPALIGAKNATASTPGTNYCNWMAFGFTENATDGFA